MALTDVVIVCVKLMIGSVASAMFLSAQWCVQMAPSTRHPFFLAVRVVRRCSPILSHSRTLAQIGRMRRLSGVLVVLVGVTMALARRRCDQHTIRSVAQAWAAHDRYPPADVNTNVFVQSRVAYAGWREGDGEREYLVTLDMAMQWTDARLAVAGSCEWHANEITSNRLEHIATRVTPAPHLDAVGESVRHMSAQHHPVHLPAHGALQRQQFARARQSGHGRGHTQLHIRHALDPAAPQRSLPIRRGQHLRPTQSHAGERRQRGDGHVGG